ncbi:tRNA (adenine(22)-N(1))-methyltransferase TrmK [Vibrio renipiscarius]|uniref:tRNA (adenine(22)-N(1))-methyltransferase n=1 Tax=Vibrio renipiscarius TaxID=1461322 RepID=UPI00355200BE
MKLSKRLKHLDQMVSGGYRHIWDCCCDHGFLGMTLLSRQAADNVHFVDIVPNLMREVEANLQRFYASSSSQWHTHCMDVAMLPLHQHQGPHLVIIAGVGGDLITQFVDSIVQRFPDAAIDFLLCPVHHQYSLRKKLVELEFSLLQEVLVEDNQRFYELLLVSSVSDVNRRVHPVGKTIWLGSTEEQAAISRKYLAKTLDHYRRMQQSQREDVAQILSAYQAVNAAFLPQSETIK